MLNKAYDKHNPYERVKRTIAEEADQLPLSFGKRKKKRWKKEKLKEEHLQNKQTNNKKKKTLGT